MLDKRRLWKLPHEVDEEDEKAGALGGSMHIRAMEVARTPSRATKKQATLRTQMWPAPGEPTWQNTELQRLRSLQMMRLSSLQGVPGGRTMQKRKRLCTAVEIRRR